MRKWILLCIAIVVISASLYVLKDPILRGIELSKEILPKTPEPGYNIDISITPTGYIVVGNPHHKLWTNVQIFVNDRKICERAYWTKDVCCKSPFKEEDIKEIRLVINKKVLKTVNFD